MIEQELKVYMQIGYIQLKNLNFASHITRINNVSLAIVRQIRYTPPFRQINPNFN